MSDIFISHIEEDADIAIKIASGLEGRGYTTWYYERDSLIGPQYLLQIPQAIKQSKAMLVIISPDSLGSNQVTNEVIMLMKTANILFPCYAILPIVNSNNVSHCGNKLLGRLRHHQFLKN